jgi:hypothetical protein
MYTKFYLQVLEQPANINTLTTTAIRASAAPIYLLHVATVLETLTQESAPEEPRATFVATVRGKRQLQGIYVVNDSLAINCA